MTQIAYRIGPIAAASALFVSAPALAQTLSYDLTAEVGQVCGVYNAEGQTIEVDFGALANTPADQFIGRAAVMSPIAAMFGLALPAR